MLCSSELHFAADCIATSLLQFHMQHTILSLYNRQPSSEQPPDPGNPVTLRNCSSVPGRKFGCMTARPSKIRHIEELFDGRTPAPSTVKCMHLGNLFKDLKSGEE
jgi:hypothetical protein